MAVRAFKFNEDEYEQTKGIYLGILSRLGIENPEAYLEERLASIPKEERDGQVFSRIVAEMFYDDDKKYIAWLSDKEQRSSKYKGIVEEANNKRRQKSVEVLKEALVEIEGNDDKDLAYIVGYFGEMAGEFIPFDTVLTAGNAVGEGKSLQMGCGEGKTGVLSLAAYVKLRDPSKQVFLTSSTPILAAEALDKLDFYDRVGIADKVCLISSEGITRARMDPTTGRAILNKEGKVEKEVKSFKGKSEEEIRLLLEEAYKSPLISSDNATLMQHAMKGYLPKPEPGIERELLADEADFVLLDSYRPLQQTREMSDKEKAEAIKQRKIAYQILQGVDKEGLYIMDDANQYVDFTNKGREAVVSKIEELFKNNPDVDKNRIFDYVYDALVVDTVYKENRDYQILDGGKTLVSEDRASGVAIDLPEGVKQALEIKLQSEGKYIGEISEEKQVLDTLNVQSFFSEFFNGGKHFVSGTLGLNSEEIVAELEENYQVSKNEGDIYEIPPKGAGQRIDQGKTMFRTQEEKRKAVIDNAIEALESNRPVLIGAVSEKEILELQKELESRKLKKETTVLIYTAASEGIFARDKKELTDELFKSKYGVEKEVYGNYAELIKKESGKKDRITLGTSIIGRGTTIKTSGEVNGAGGIHVIIDGLHETSSRNQEQYKARTARGTDLGTTKEFFALDDIPEEYRKDYEDRLDDPDGVYQDVYKRIDSRTSNIRHNVVKLVQLTRRMVKSMTERRKQVHDQSSGQATVELSDEEKAKIKGLTVARAASIRNRACGVSDERFGDAVEQYEQEIETYAMMYYAKITDPKFKGEKEWLVEKGFEDMAKRHIPFSAKKEREIFTLAGVKSQALEARSEDFKKVSSETRGMATPTQEQSREEGDLRNDQ